MQQVDLLEPDEGPSGHRKLPQPRFLYFLSAMASLGGFLFGYDTGIMSSHMEQLRVEFRLSSVWQEAIISGATLLAVVAALLGGVVNHFLGRRRVIMGAAVICFIGAIILTSATSRGVLLLGRCFLGMGFGFESTTVSIYIAEAAPAQIRGRLVSLNIAMTAFGQFVGSVLSGSTFQHSDSGWRISAGLATLPAALQFLAFFLYLPESPQWLIRKGQLDLALSALQACRGPKIDAEEEFNAVVHAVHLHEGEDSIKGDPRLVGYNNETNTL